MRIRLVLAVAALACVAGPAYGQTATWTWTIPGTVNASGLNGTQFVSDLAITNPGSASAIAVLTLLPANGTPQSVQFLAPGQTLVVRNVLQALWGTSGAAATVVTATSPLLIRARTYNTAPSGTYGVALPVVADDRFLDASTPAESLWVSQSADPSSGYRTNIAVVFPDPDGGAATVTVFDAGGNAIGHQDYALATAGFQQFAVGSFAGSVAVARAELLVTRGSATGYSVVVDNVTGDSSLFQFEALPAGRQDVLVNGVARASGRNNTFFRTDARIFNPGPADATVTVAFHANGSANPAPATASFAVPAGKILDVVDVLQSLLGLPVGSAGALRFTSDTNVAILCRTSNVDPTGVRPGTYGAQQKPVPLASFLMSADSGGVVTGIRQNAAFRTNIGFAAGADGAAYSLVLQNTAGVVAANTSGSLGPYGWTQPNVQDLFPGTSIPDDATLLVTVTSGSVDVFDSSIDNTSGDPVVTPIMPLPVTIPSSATIGPAGGSVLSDDGRFLFRIPAGALASATAVGITTTSDEAPNASGPAYSVTPGDLTLSKPALVSFDYGPDDVNGSAPDLLVPVLLGASGSWYGIPGWTVDTRRQQLTVSLPAPTPAVRTEPRLALVGRVIEVQMVRRLSLEGDMLVPPGHNAPYAVKGVTGGSQYTWELVTSDVSLTSQTYTWDASVGTFAGDTGQSAVYHAPACPPSGDPTVLIEAHFETSGGPKKAVKAIVIFPDFWYANVIEVVNSTCGSQALSYAATGVAKQTFAIDHKKGTVQTLDYTETDPTLSNTAVCQDGCTFQVTAASSNLTMSSFGGKVTLAGYLHPKFAWKHVGTPSFNITCTTPVFHVTPVTGAPGANEPATDKGPLPWRGKDDSPPPVIIQGYQHTVTFSIRPDPFPQGCQ